MTWAAVAIGTGSLVGGIGGYLGASSQADASQTNTQEQIQMSKDQLNFEKQKYLDSLAAKANASNIINNGMNTSSYDVPYQFSNAYAPGLDTSINAFLSGQLTPAQQAQKAQDIATGNQVLNANAATMGLTAGGRAALTNQLSQGIDRTYANVAGNNIATGIQAAQGQQRFDAGQYQTGYQYGLGDFLNSQNLQNQKAQLQAGYATPTGSNVSGQVPVQRQVPAGPAGQRLDHLRLAEAGYRP